MILSLAAFPNDKFVKHKKGGLGDIVIHDPINPEKIFFYGSRSNNKKSRIDDGLKLDDLINQRSKKLTDSSHDKKAYLLENHVNMTNNELFGYLNLSKEEAEKYINRLEFHNPPILISQKKYNKSIYKIEDQLLKQFVMECILAFNSCVDERLMCSYIYNGVSDKILQKAYRNNQLRNYTNNNDKKIDFPYTMNKITKDILKKYRKNMHIWYGDKRKLNELFSLMNARKKEIEQRESSLRYESIHHYNKIIDDYDKKIIDCKIFDNEFVSVNEQYKSISKNYSFVVNIFLDLLFPEFLKDIWKRKKIKSENLS